MATFVLSDGRIVNSYGFRINTQGINLTRFLANPVMLEDHIGGIGGVLGNWQNVKIDGALLMADSNFDDGDDTAVKAKGKVDRGFVKGASVGILYNPDDMVMQPDGNWELTKCEMLEASITPLPSNAGALKLFVSKDGKLHQQTLEEVKLSLSALSAEEAIIDKTKNQQTDMKKVILSLAALTFLDLQKANSQEGVDVTLVEQAVAELKTKLDDTTSKLSAQKLAYEALKKQVDEANAEKTKTMLDAAQLAGKFDAQDRQVWEELSQVNLLLAERTLSSIPAKKSLAAQLNNPNPSGVEDVKTADDFEKLPLEKQLAFKEANPEAYKKLFA